MWVANLKNRHPVSLRQLLPFRQFRGLCGHSRHQRFGTKPKLHGWLLVRGHSRQPGGWKPFYSRSDRARSKIAALRAAASGVPVPQCIVPHVRAAYAKLCQALFGMPSRRMKTVGVTGTNGKTTTTYLVRSILAAANHQTGLLGTIEYHDGISSEPSQLTTPDPPRSPNG